MLSTDTDDDNDDVGGGCGGGVCVVGYGKCEHIFI